VEDAEATVTALDDFVVWASVQSPGVILKKLETSSFSGKKLAGALQAANNLQTLAAETDEITAQKNSKMRMQVVSAALYSTGVLAPAGLAVSLFSALPLHAISMAWPTLRVGPTGNLEIVSGPPITCSSPGNLTSPNLLHGDYVAPRSLASLVIPVLCEAFYDIERCWELVPTSMSWAAIASNIAIASIANLWNSVSYGSKIDYFVPYVPCSGMAASHGDATNDPITQGWGGWNGAGLRNKDMGPWDKPPPFVVTGQGKYAFWPLSMVPKDVADPATEYPNVDRGVWTGNSSWQQPGWKWSRLSANAGPLPTVMQKTLDTTVKVAGAAGVAAVAAPFLAKAITGKSIEAILKGIIR
jgi:hypothetical protein